MQNRLSNARVCARLLKRPLATPQGLQKPARREGGGRPPSALRPLPPPRPHGAPPPSPTRCHHPPLRRCSATSQGSWYGAEALCRTAWRRCGGGGSVSSECRGCAVRCEPSQVWGARRARAWQRPRLRLSSREAGCPLPLTAKACGEGPLSPSHHPHGGERPAGALLDRPLWGPEPAAHPGGATLLPQRRRRGGRRAASFRNGCRSHPRPGASLGAGPRPPRC